MTTGFNIHGVRHRVKLLRDDGDTMLARNRDGMTCPAYGDDFSQLLISNRVAHSFDMNADTRFCVWRDSDRLLMTTHE